MPVAELTCPSCGRENPEGFGFCGFCGASLTGPAVGREERKVVTVLFCDLVGFTARSDRADPEDVKATLRPYHARLKREIEAFGGTLDKFIGDAALGVFGSPLAHEDDPERAIRAALGIRAAMAELNEADPSLRLAVRQGINTGEAVVAYGAGPQIGEAVTGDVVNTASRLQAVAPAGGIVVGEATHGATKDVFVFEPLDPVTVKGKGEPLEVWLAIRALGRSSAELARSHATPFVGRDLDLAQLEEAYLAAADGRSVQLVTITGEPGVGKSRLVAELSRRIEDRPGKIRWRSGRCLPYGEGITFWALSEIVKAHAGILESDPPDEASAKLDAGIPTGEPDREWLRQRLGPLIGLEAASAAQRDEAFMAWRRFLESMALTGPAVLVFEDLHWADPALLEFIEHLLGSSREVPLLLICTARPELRDRYPGWAEGARWVTLHPLSADETVGLISAMLDRASLPPQVLALLLERAGGNPLYAQEFVRMLKDRGLLSRVGESWELVEGADIPYPDSIQSLIAARLDTLAPSAKAVLQDASIIGKVFWPGAVAAIGGSDEALVRTSLDEATSRDLVSVAPTSSIAGEAELVFSHALVRDVCYGQIPRAARATKHRAAAEWIEAAGSERVEELAEVLVHHYTTALGLSKAAKRQEDTSDLESRAIRFLELAGDRALGLDAARAEAHYARALELSGPDHLERPDLLAKWADSARQTGRASEATAALEQSVESFLARGDRVAAARALGTLSSVFVMTGNSRQEDVARDAVRLLESASPGQDLVAAYARMAGVKLVQGDTRETIAWADRATSLAAELGVDVPARAIGFRGYARCSLGDGEGIEEMRAALELAIQRGEGRDAAVLYNNLAVAVLAIEGPRGVLSVGREGIEFSERRGIREIAMSMAAGNLDQLIDTGEWDAALDQAESIAGLAEASGDVASLLQARWAQTRLLALRGETVRAAALADWLVPAARESGGVEDIISGFTSAALAYLRDGRPAGALGLLSEIDLTPNSRDSPTYPAFLCAMVRTAIEGGDVELASRLASGLEPLFPYHEHALRAVHATLAQARHAFDEALVGHAAAAASWESFGLVPERGYALLGLGRCLLEVGRAGAAGPLQEARAIFTRLGAAADLAVTDALFEA